MHISESIVALLSPKAAAAAAEHEAFARRLMQAIPLRDHRPPFAHRTQARGEPADADPQVAR